MINEERRKIQEEALSALEQNDYNGIIVLPTGVGKSWVMIEALKRIREKVGSDIDILYLCNSTDLRDKDFVSELYAWNAVAFYDHMTLMCYQSAYKMKGNRITVLLADELLSIIL